MPDIRGIVVDRERVKTQDADYVLLHLKNRARPLAIREGSIWPPNGSIINAKDPRPGKFWDFATSREVSVDTDPAPPYDLEARIPGIAGLLIPLILDWLRWHRTCTSDDIHDKALLLIGNRDPRVIGVAFAFLSRRGIIKFVGTARSKRQVNHHYPRMSVWELVMKPLEAS